MRYSVATACVYTAFRQSAAAEPFENHSVNLYAPASLQPAAARHAERILYSHCQLKLLLVQLPSLGISGSFVTHASATLFNCTMPPRKKARTADAKSRSSSTSVPNAGAPQDQTTSAPTTAVRGKPRRPVRGHRGGLKDMVVFYKYVVESTWDETSGQASKYRRGDSQGVRDIHPRLSK